MYNVHGLYIHGYYNYYFAYKHTMPFCMYIYIYVPTKYYTRKRMVSIHQGLGYIYKNFQNVYVTAAVDVKRFMLFYIYIHIFSFEFFIQD